MPIEEARMGFGETKQDRSWYALYTRHQHEKTASGILAAKGFEVFLPLYPAVHQWKDRAKKLSLPLFPCYVFIHTNLESQLRVLTTPGVHAFVGTEGRAARIPSDQIEGIRRTLESLLHVEPHPFLRTGDWVRVKKGPLEGVEGILVRKTNRYRLVLSVEMLEKSVAVEVDPEVVERSRSRNNTGSGLVRADVWRKQHESLQGFSARGER